MLRVQNDEGIFESDRRFQSHEIRSTESYSFFYIVVVFCSVRVVLDFTVTVNRSKKGVSPNSPCE